MKPVKFRSISSSSCLSRTRSWLVNAFDASDREISSEGEEPKRRLKEHAFGLLPEEEASPKEEKSERLK